MSTSNASTSTNQSKSHCQSGDIDNHRVNPNVHISTSTSTIPKVYNCIDGELVGSLDDEWIDNINPATQTIIAHIPRSKNQDVDKAVNAARAAFPAWAALSYEQRANYLDKIANAIEKRLDDFALAESRDSGKALSTAKTIDIPRAVANFRFFAGEIRHASTECHMMGDAMNYTIRSPVGVCSLITPWNLPLYLLSWKIAPALAMGNVVIAKPSELTPTTASMLAELCHSAEVGLPKGVLQITHGLGGEVGNALVTHQQIPLISFTGGTSSGKIVAASAAPLFKKLSLELGGKNSSIVFSDAEFEKTVQGVARAAFTNNGQVCLCGSRILIEESIYDRFVNAFVIRVEELSKTVGDPLTQSIGSLSSQAHLEKIESYVELAKKDGAQILCGGKKPELQAPFDKGAFYLPTVIQGLSITHPCSVEEIFGPVVVLHPFKNEEDAIQICNNTKYGLAGSVWTTNLAKAHRVSRSIDSGMIWVNCWLHRDLRVPFGGIKESGVGTEGGRHSLEFYSHTKNICIHNQ